MFFAGIIVIGLAKETRVAPGYFKILDFLKNFTKNEMSTYLQNRVLKRSHNQSI